MPGFSSSRRGGGGAWLTGRACEDEDLLARNAASLFIIGGGEGLDVSSSHLAVSQEPPINIEMPITAVAVVKEKPEEDDDALER